MVRWKTQRTLQNTSSPIVRSALRPHQKRWCVGKHNPPYKIQLPRRVRSALRPHQKNGALENTTHPTKHNLRSRVRSALRPHQKNGALENTTHPTKYNLPRRVRSALRPHQKMVRWKTQRTLQNTVISRSADPASRLHKISLVSHQRALVRRPASTNTIPSRW